MAHGRRFLVTGATGFVGRWAIRALRKAAPDAEIVAAVRSGERAEGGLRCVLLDLTDDASVEAAVRDVAPTAILHLGAISAIADARRDPRMAWKVNLGGTLALATAVTTHAPGARIVFAGTAEAYGASFRSTSGAVDETTPLAPANAYAASKAAADLLLGQVAAEGGDVVRFRPFNHIGPGQSERFVASAFAAQIARIEAGLQPPVLRVGNLEAERDFTDVRDVVDAYATAMTMASPCDAAGSVFNLATGTPRRIADVLSALLALTPARITVEQDAALMRPSDTPRAVGDAARAKAVLGWSPSTPFAVTLEDLLTDWRREVRAG